MSVKMKKDVIINRQLGARIRGMSEKLIFKKLLYFLINYYHS